MSLENFRQNFLPSKKPYFEVKLVNRCLLHEKFFAIEVLGQPGKFYFQNAKSKIFVKKGNKIRLSIDERYQDYIICNWMSVLTCDSANSPVSNGMRLI